MQSIIEEEMIFNIINGILLLIIFYLVFRIRRIKLTKVLAEAIVCMDDICYHECAAPDTKEQINAWKDLLNIAERGYGLTSEYTRAGRPVREIVTLQDLQKNEYGRYKLSRD